MAIVTVPEVLIPVISYAALSSATEANHTMDAAGEMMYQLFISPVAGNVRKFHFLTGTVAQAHTVRVSCRDIDPATGFPDATDDQQVDISIADTDDSAWKTTGNLSSDRTVAIGDIFAVVFSFPSFTAGDIFRLRSGEFPRIYTNPSGLYTTSWSKKNPLIVLAEMSDGTYIQHNAAPLPINAVTSITISSASNPVRRGNRVNYPITIRISGVSFSVYNDSASEDMKVTLCGSDGITVLATALPNPRGGLIGISGGSAVGQQFYFSSSQTLTANTNYYLYIENTGSNNIALYYVTFDTLAIKNSTRVKNFYYNTQHSTNSPTETDTAFVYMNLLIDGIDVPSSGGGLLTHPGMSGGMRG